MAATGWAGAKRFLTPLQQYEIWLQLVRGETTITEVADRYGVDRSTIMRLRTMARLLDLLCQATQAGWTVRAACQALQVSELRTYRWLHRRAAGELADHPPGGPPMHGLLDLGGRRDRAAVRRVGRGRPLAPQARPPRLVSGAGVARPQLCAGCWSARACGCGRCLGPAGRSASRSPTGSSMPPTRSGSSTVKVAGHWRYVYRAIDQFGQVIDVFVSPRRVAGAARRFFQRAIGTTEVAPAEVTTD